MTRATLATLALLLSAASARAQQDVPLQRHSPTLVKYGKWATLAGAVAMNIMAAREHDRADRAFAFITRSCVQATSNCATLPDGTYVNPVLEQKYQDSLGHDRSARRWLIGGETALVGTAVMFIWELTRSRTRPANIPFEPEVGQRNGQTTVGFHLAF